jgi:uncharacterized OsmC-like protein
MQADDLKALQAPLKDAYRQDPARARLALRATGELVPGAGPVCRVGSHTGTVEAGLHPAAGGDGSQACAGTILLEALVACAGVTLGAVATAMSLPIDGGTIWAEGEMDMRGTLGVSREAPVGFTSIRLGFDLQSPAEPEKLAKLVELTERYCVVYQTLRNPPAIQTELR